MSEVCAVAALKRKRFIAAVDWLGRYQTIATIVAAMGGTTLTAAILKAFAGVNGLWLATLVCGGFVLFFCFPLFLVERGWIKLGSLQADPTLSKPGSLQQRARQLASDLFAFLREKGPEPQPDRALAPMDQLVQVWKANEPYIEKVRCGYDHRFRRPVVDFFSELGEHGVDVPELEASDLNPPHGQSADRIKKIANTLYLVAARLEAATAAEGT